MEIYVPRPEVVITRQWNGLFVKFQRQIPCFQGRRVQWTYRRHCPRLIASRKSGNGNVQPLRPEVVITTQWNLLPAKFQREYLYFRGRQSQRNCPWYCPTLITNRKWKCTPTDCTSCCWLLMYVGRLNRWVKHLPHIKCAIRQIFEVKYPVVCTFVCVEFQFTYICTGHPYRLPVW